LKSILRYHKSIEIALKVWSPTRASISVTAEREAMAVSMMKAEKSSALGHGSVYE
jgi:hypothetical protein